MADDNFTAAIEMGDAGAVRWLINWMVQMLRIFFSKAAAYCQIWCHFKFWNHTLETKVKLE